VRIKAWGVLIACLKFSIEEVGFDLKVAWCF
jgi:hypothetical protein